MFEIGDTVLCVDAGIKPEALFAVATHFPEWVKQGTKYTVRGFTDNDGIVEGIWLEEIVNPAIYIKLLGRTQEPAFGLFRFAKSEKASVKSEVEEKSEVLI